MNHNKKRNTAFLYEILLREGTKATLSKNLNRAKIVKKVIFEHFNSNTEIYKELELYKCLKKNIIEEEYAEKYLKEIENRYDKLNKTKLFNEQTQIINKINKLLGHNVFNNFVPNYKNLATIAQIFNDKTKVKDKILLEKNIIEEIKIIKENKQTNQVIVDNVLFNVFNKKFNEKYTNLLSEQKQLLNKYVTSISENGLEFRVFLNEELERLKKAINDSLEIEDIKSDEKMVQKTKETYNFLDSFKQIKDINQDMLQKILKIQQFVHEVSK